MVWGRGNYLSFLSLLLKPADSPQQFSSKGGENMDFRGFIAPDRLLSSRDELLPRQEGTNSSNREHYQRLTGFPAWLRPGRSPSAHPCGPTPLFPSFHTSLGSPQWAYTGLVLTKRPSTSGMIFAVRALHGTTGSRLRGG